MEPLLTIFSAYLAEANEEKKTDEQMVEFIVMSNNYDVSQACIKQIEQLLIEAPFPLSEIKQAVNRAFINEKECKEWLSQIAEYFKEYLRGKEAS